MLINPSIFREYDIRGLAERDFAPAAMELIAKGIAVWYKKNIPLPQNRRRKIALGHDCREHSPRLHDALAQALTEHGFDLISIGHCTTPSLYNACFTMDVDGGVMVTASHNPAPDNGMKMLLGKDALFGSQIQEIFAIVQAISNEPEAAYAKLESPAGIMLTDAEHNNRYISDLLGRITMGQRPLKVVVDCGNGSSGPSTEKALMAFGDSLHVTKLYFEPDGSFPNHEADPVKPKNLVDLIERVRREQADLGIAFDGDGDRIGVVDERGEIIWGDRLMVLFWREIMQKHPGALGLVEVKCSQVLFDEIARLGGRPVFTRTGHSLIKARMKEESCVFAGELSGHIFFADEYYGYDDALYAALRLLRILSNTDKKLSELLADLPVTYSTPEVRIDCPDEIKFGVVEKLSAKLAKGYEVVTIDGVRVIFQSGWGLFRASNTQAAIVCRAEATTEEQLNAYKSLLSAVYEEIVPNTRIPW